MEARKSTLLRKSMLVVNDGTKIPSYENAKSHAALTQ